MRMEDLGRRLYDTYAKTCELLEPKAVRFTPTRWDDLPEWRKEVWVTMAQEAIKIGVEVQRDAVRISHGIDTSPPARSQPLMRTEHRTKRCEAECSEHKAHLEDGTPVPNWQEEKAGMRCNRPVGGNGVMCILFRGHDGMCQ